MGEEANLFGPSQATAIAQVAITAGATTPFGRGAGVAIGAVFLELAEPLSAFALLFVLHKAVEFFRQQAIATLHLAQFELPAGAARGFEFFKHVVLGCESFVLRSDGQAVAAGLRDHAFVGCILSRACRL